LRLGGAPDAYILDAQLLTRVAATTLTLPVTPTFDSHYTLNNLAFTSLSQSSRPRAKLIGSSCGKPGRIMVVRNLGTASPTSSVFLDITGPVIDSGEEGLLALAFHPDFAANGYFYVWYTLNTTTNAWSGRHDRLSRFRVSAGNPNLADADSEQPLISQYDEASNHNGGEIKFGPDGFLYLTIGDEGAGADATNVQRIDRDFFSAMLRIDVDQLPGSLVPNTHPAVHAGTYRIPADNPFVGVTAFNGAAVDPASTRTEFWAVGLRNPFRFSFDSATGELWLADVGASSHEEIDIVTRGGNYGWWYREGFSSYVSNPPAAANFTNPIHDYPRSEGQSVTGGIVYRGSQISQLYGAYLFADYSSGRVWSLRYTNPGPAVVELLTTNPGIVGFGVNPANGDILLANINEGSIRRLVYSTQSGTPFPATLSATGAFSSLENLTPAAGVVAYEPNVSFWSDHARKSRWFALPDATSTFGYQATANWTLPTGAKWVKHIDLELTRGDPYTAPRIETRFLVKTSDGVYGLSYRWNDAQTDATLVPESGADLDITVVENGISRTQSWRFPSRAECLTCHTPQGGYALSFNTRQLNRVHAFPGGSANQLSALAEAGYLNATPASPDTLPAVVPPSDTSQSIELRVKSYLDANCSQCHRPGASSRTVRCQ
jgi:glucose/arabinose dehydrogenase